MNAFKAGRNAWNLGRTFVRNSPWLSMAILLHVLAVALLSLFYVARAPEIETTSTFTASLAAPPVVLPELIDEPPQVVERDPIPIFDNEELKELEPTEVDLPIEMTAFPGPIDPAHPELPPDIMTPDPSALDTLPPGATGGTPIGVGLIGHHGTGVPSDYSSRRAGPGGAGKQDRGSLQGGPRRVTSDPERAVLPALTWLKEHQSPDGGWDCDGFQAQCKKNECGGAGDGAHDVGVTGLALLCYLGAGYTHEQPGPFRETVAKGLRYLTSVQDEDGCFGARIGQHFLYDHACAALAMAEAYGMTQVKLLREPAQRGIQFVLRAQNPYGAWRYGFPPDGDNDTSVTGWMVMALKSAKMAELTIDDQALRNAAAWIDGVTDPATGRTGYTDIGGLPSRLTELLDRFPAQRSESMTAVGVLTRIFAGATADDPMVEKGADLMAARPPLWDEQTGDIDFYYWYYGTLAMFQVSGPRWERWNAAVKSAVIDHQHVDRARDQYGSWDPVDPWSSVGGRVYSTALNCLTMEVYYRYPRVFGTRKK